MPHTLYQPFPIVGDYWLHLRRSITLLLRTTHDKQTQFVHVTNVRYSCGE